MRKILLLFAIAVSHLSFGQGLKYHDTTFFPNDNNTPYAVPTPNQGELGTFGNIPMFPYTGKVDVNVPIYNTTQRGVTLDVSLHYDTSGLLINQLPGWTGHNWTLTSGGAITRKINGRPDELNLRGTAAGRDVFLLYSNIYRDYSVMSNGAFNNIFEVREDPYSYELISSSLLSNEQIEVDSCNGFTNYFTNAPSNRNLNNYVNIPYHDTSADIFHFNFMGISGSFFYGNDGNWKVMCDHNIDVLFDVNDTTNYIMPLEDTYWFNSSNAQGEANILIVKQPKTIKGFTLVDENGNKYIFGGDKSCIEYSMPLTGKCAVNTTEPWNAVSWMLKEVKDRFGNTLYSFNYSRGEYITQIHNSYNSLTSISKSTNSLFPVHHTPDVCSCTLNSPVYLDKISIIDGTKLNFIHSNMFEQNARNILYPNFSNTDIGDMLKASYKRLTYQDYAIYAPFYDPVNYQYSSFVYSHNSCSSYLNRMNLEKLKYIRISSEGSDKEMTYALLYDNNSRIHLDAILFGNGNETSYSYKFEYDRFDSIPSDYLTKQYDHWGYYNGIDYNHDSIMPSAQGGIQKFEEYQTRSSSTHKIARVSDLRYATMGMLKRISYPTGGSTTLEYEQNSCSKYISDDKQICYDAHENVPVGGLRIKKIENYDKGNLIGCKTYTYNIPETSYSSGELYSIPNTHYEFEDNSYVYQVDIACSTIPISDSYTPIVGYSYVTETNMDGTSKTYEYSNYSSEKDESGNIMRYYTLTPYSECSSRRYMCGRLLSETKKTNTGDMVQYTKYNYYPDSEYNSNNYVTTTSFNFLDIIGNVGNIYKLFYFKSGIKDIVTKTRYNNGWVTDSISYERGYNTLSINNANGSTHNIDVFKTMSETINRKGNQLKTEYTYPFLENGINRQLANQFYLPITEVKRYANGTLISGSKTIYSNIGQIVPKYEVAYLTNQNKCDTIIRYSSYSPSYRVTEIYDKNNVFHSYYWDYKDRLVASSSNNFGRVQIYRDLGATISANPNTMFASKPIETQLYEYDTQGNLTKMIKDNRITTRYTYDMFNRLEGVYDTNDNLKKSYSYHYVPKTNTPTLYDLSRCNIQARVDYTNNEKVIVANYHLPYNISLAEVKVQYCNSSNVIYSEPLSLSNADGELRIGCNPFMRGMVEVCIMVDGTKKDSVILNISNNQ